MIYLPQFSLIPRCICLFLCLLHGAFQVTCPIQRCLVFPKVSGSFQRAALSSSRIFDLLSFFDFCSLGLVGRLSMFLQPSTTSLFPE